MAKIQTFELDRWSEPDENHRVKHIGMADAKETFDKLKTHLEAHGLLPDEYFSFSGKYEGLTGELAEFEEALCIPNFGSSEGIYLDISLACRDSDGKRYFQSFATGKTLGETADDYFRMFRIAAECSLMLNGRGFSYERNNVNRADRERGRSRCKFGGIRSVRLFGAGGRGTVVLRSGEVRWRPLHGHPDHHLSWTRRLRCLECGDSVRYVPLHCP